MSACFGPVYAPRDHAGFVRRTAALLIDAVVLIATLFALAYLWHRLAPPEWLTDRATRYIIVFWYFVVAAYVIGLRLTVRGTLGYRLMRIEYAYMLADKPKWYNLAFRALLAPVLMWFFALDHLWILVDQRKQAWHDKVSGFYVVRRSAQPIARTQVIQRAVNFMLLTFIVWEPMTEQAAAEAIPQADTEAATPPTHP